MGKQLFISYKRHTEHDEPLATRLYTALEVVGYSVFLDQTMPVGSHWPKRIHEALAASDFLVLLISEASIESSMVAEEVRMAQQLYTENQRPQILPVRVRYDGSLSYDLGAILNPLSYTEWHSEADDARLIAELCRAVEGKIALLGTKQTRAPLSVELPLPSANPLEAPEGTMMPNSPYYVARPADAIVDDELQHLGYTLSIQAPRQMGKSSLLGRIMQRERGAGKKVAFVDFQAFGQAELQDTNELCRQFAFMVEDALELDEDSELEKYWKVPLSPIQKCHRFMERRILKACDGKLLLALDEADALLDSPACSDFFGMLRSWHNERAVKPHIWQHFSLAMVISTEPAMLIANLAQSPFNVGTNVKLEDFTLDEARRIHLAHGAPLNDAELRQLYELLGGHPYLLRKAFYLLKKQRYTLAELLREQDSESGPFGDQLRALLTRLYRNPELTEALRRVVRNGNLDGTLRHRLIAGGMIKEQNGRLVARNPLFAAYFQRVL